MADPQKVKLAIQAKITISDRHLSRLVTEKQNALLSTRDIALLAVARDKGVAINGLANAEDLIELRALTASPSPKSVPASVSVGPPKQTRQRARATAPNAAPSITKKPTRGRKVFVVYGRDDTLRKDLFAFLRALNLEPMEWTKGIAATKSGSPTVMQIIDAIFEQAVAAVVLLSPDDESQLKAKFHKASDPEYEKTLTGQARPNVLFEAGIAYGRHPNSTVIVQVGRVKPFTDIGGIHVSHLNDSPESRADFVQKLKNTGAQVDSSTTDWYTTGDFSGSRQDEK